MLRIGDKVICVDASPLREDCQPVMPHRLTLGEVYTVRALHVEAGIEGYGFQLEELRNPVIAWSDGTVREWSYNAKRFVPLAGRRSVAELNHKAWAESAVAFIRNKGLEHEFLDFCGGWPCLVGENPIAEIEAAAAGKYWQLSKGRLREAEPLFGAAVIEPNTNELLLLGEGDSVSAAIRAMRPRPKQPSDEGAP